MSKSQARTDVNVAEFSNFQTRKLLSSATVSTTARANKKQATPHKKRKHHNTKLSLK
jgi:hypothetical protein